MNILEKVRSLHKHHIEQNINLSEIANENNLIYLLLLMSLRS